MLANNKAHGEEEKPGCGFVLNNFVCVLLYPAPERVVDTEGDCGGVPPISFPYGPADGGVGDERMLVLPPMASSESTANWGILSPYTKL